MTENRNLQPAKRRQRIGRLVIDYDLTDEDISKLVFAIGRDSPYFAEVATANRIDVFMFVNDTPESESVNDS